MKNRASALAAPVGVGLLSLVLGLITLDRKSLWYDEAFNGEHIKSSWHDLVLLVSHTEMSQGAYLVFLKAWAAVTVNNTLWLRLPSVAAAALAAALLVPLGTRLFDRTTGIAAGVLLATNELVVRWSQQARTYALVTLAVVVATILFVRALDDPRRRNWLLYAVAAAFAVYCHFWAGFVIVAHFASVPFAPQRPPRRRVGEAGVLFLALIGPALFFTVHAARSQLTWIPDPSINVLRNLVTVTSGHNVALEIATIGGLAVLGYQAWGGTRTRTATWRLALVGGWIFLPIVLALIVSEVRQPIVVARYAIVLTPALALASALLLTTLARGRLLVVGTALVLIVAIPGPRIVDWYRSQPEDWRGAASYVAHERRPDESVVIGPDWAILAFRYYNETTPVVFSPPTGRTLLVLRARTEDDAALNRAKVLGTAQRPLLSERRFGDRLRVLLLGPPS